MKSEVGSRKKIGMQVTINSDIRPQTSYLNYQIEFSTLNNYAVI